MLQVMYSLTVTFLYRIIISTVHFTARNAGTVYTPTVLLAMLLFSLTLGPFFPDTPGTPGGPLRPWRETKIAGFHSSGTNKILSSTLNYRD